MPSTAGEPATLFFLLLVGDLPFCLNGRLLGLGRFTRLLHCRSLGWFAHFGSYGRFRRHHRLRSSNGFRRCRKLRRRDRLPFVNRDRDDRCDRRRRNSSLPLSARLAACHRRNNNSSRCSLSSSTPLGWRRRRRRWWWRRQRLQKLQSLGSRTQLAIQQQQEHIVRNLRIRRHLRRDAEFRHLRQRNLLLHLSPLRKKILDLLRHRLLPRRDRKKQNHLRTRRRQQLPGPRRRGRFLTRQALRQTMSVRIQILPGFDQILARNRPAQIRNILVAQPLGQKIHHRRRNLRRIPKLVHLLPRLHQRAQSGRINLGRAPMRVQYLQPSLFFVRFQNAVRIVLVRQLLDLVSDARTPYVLDVPIFFPRFITRLRSLLQRPVEARGKARGADHARRILEKRVVMQHANHFRFDVRNTVKWIH